ncbi:MAG: S49 family peptidase [Gammaproteobacteria bacterium]|nr:S49 family peptidase [Gammaproteobacteria bacterium]
MTIRAIDLIAATPWAITAEELERICTIAVRENDSPDAVAARLGRPLENARTVTERDGTAIIPITGSIFRRANLFTEISGATSVEVLATDIQAAIDSPSIARLVLHIDSPGGQATGIGDLAALIHASPKPIIAFVEGIAASAAYWLASAADRIVVSSGAMLGSIGVVASFRPEKDAPTKIISSQSPLKQAGPDTEPGRAEIQRVVDALAAVFIGDVAAYRNTDPQTVAETFGRGGLLVGADAVAAGMADAVGTLETLLASFKPSAGSTGITATGTTMTDTTTGAPTIDRAHLAAHHPALLAELLAEGAQTERARIQGVRAQAIPGHEALIERLAFDGATTGPEAAVQVLAAEKALRDHHAAAQATAAPPVNAVLPPAAQTDDSPQAKTESAAVAILANYRTATGTAA